MSIKVILADDHSIVRAGIRAVLNLEPDIRIAGEAATGAELLTLVKHTAADVYIIDISMPDLNGIEAIKQMRALHLAGRSLVLSMHDSRTFVEKAIQAGAHGYILKEQAAAEISAGVRTAHAGGYFISPRLQGVVVEGFLAKRAATCNSPLTRQEIRVLQLIAEGNSNKEVAEVLHISTNTVHAHRNSLMRKLDLHKQSELIRYAIREGIATV